MAWLEANESIEGFAIVDHQFKYNEYSSIILNNFLT